MNRRSELAEKQNLLPQHLQRIPQSVLIKTRALVPGHHPLSANEDEGRRKKEILPNHQRFPAREGATGEVLGVRARFGLPVQHFCEKVAGLFAKPLFEVGENLSPDIHEKHQQFH